MQALNFDTGIKEYIVNGGAALHINLADPNISKRLDNLAAALQDYTAKTHKASSALELYMEYDELFRSKLDEALGEGSSDVLFGGINVLTVVNKKGQCLMETFLEAFMPLLQSDMKQAQQLQHAHIADLVDSKKLDSIASQITGESP